MNSHFSLGWSGEPVPAGLKLYLYPDPRSPHFSTQKYSQVFGFRASVWNAAFDCRVEQVLADEVDEEHEPGAYVASGVTYHNPQRGAELERARAVIAELIDVGRSL